MLNLHFNKAVHIIITVVSLFLILFLVMFSNSVGQLDLKVGDVSEDDIYAPRAIVDQLTTNARREAARKGVEDVYIHNDDKRISAVEDISKVFELASSLRSDKEIYPNKGALELSASVKLKISDETALILLQASDKEFAEMRKTVQIVDDVMSGAISDIELAKKQCQDKINALNLSSARKNAASELAGLVLTENVELNKEETELRKQSAEDSVAPIEYKKNQIIVRKGEVVSEAQIGMLTELGLIKGTSPISLTYTTGIILLVLMCYTLLLFYFHNRGRDDAHALPILALTGLITVIISSYGNRYVPSHLLAILPLGIFPGIVAIFSTPQTAIISNMILSIFCGVSFDGNWSHTICLIIAGTISAYAFSAVKRRSHLLPAAVASAVFYAITFSTMSFIEASSASAALAAFGKGLLGGILSGLITIGSIQFFEMLFNATTPMKLSELTNPENKLLKKLLVDAPGTYHHSLTVANISEIAARSIGANSLLARVGAYYHDIGKIRHPLYFKENQYDQNAHDTLSPFESSSLIISHVTDGYEISNKNRLPKAVCDIILQHHGTTSTGYFLIRAKELDPEVDEKKFCYPGPVPQTKEAAIVMLADSCEAAVRSIDEKSEAKIETMVRKIATERVNSGQLSQCNLTFAELETVIKVIIKTLGGYFHERIKYE